MKAALNQLMDNAVDGDFLFVHFSGHGTQVPHYDGDEEDGTA